MIDDFLRHLDNLEGYGVEAPAAEPSQPPERLAGGDPDFLTDLGNGRRLVAQHGNDLRYCGPLGGWLWWDGRR